MGTSVKGMLQQLQVTFDADILLNLLEFYGFVTSVKSYNKRVLLSLNGIENDTTRLLSKAEYVGVNHDRVMWDVSVFDISVIFPWRNTASEWSKLVIKSRSLCFKSKTGPESFLSEIGDQPYFLKNFSNTISTSKDCLGVRLQDLYNYFDVQLNDFKITIVNSGQSQKISILEKFCASFFMAFCLIPDESILKQLEVYVHMESLKVNFSPSIYGAFIELSTHLDSLLLRDESETLNCVYPPNIVPDASSYSTFGISVISRLGSVDLEVDLENGGDNSSVLMVSLQEIDVRLQTHIDKRYNVKKVYPFGPPAKLPTHQAQSAGREGVYKGKPKSHIDMRFVSAEFQEFFISMKSLLIRAYEVKEEKDSCFVLLSGNLSSSATDPEHSVSGPSIEFDQCSDAAVLADACFAMHYESPRTDLVCHKCFIYLSNADIHCYPHIVGLLVGFSRRLSAYSTSSEKSSASNTIDIPKNSSSFGFQEFGFSNYFEVGSADSACIPFDRFPFVTIYNSGSLGNLESSLIYPIPEWRKYVTLRDRKIISPKYFRVSSSKCKSNFRNFLESGISRISNNFSIELQLYGIRADFHDSSCIIGSIMVPTSKSSVLFCDDSMDILSSSEGLVLTSSWGPNKFQDYLWGPSTANLSPILNVRVRKARNISSTVNLEVCFGIQHVYCMLPSEYLSIIIGYFSLSDWGGGDQFLLHEQGDIVLKSEVYVTYKFEILDCDLFLPVESNEHQFLKVELPQLYGCYIENSNFDDVLKNIPTECLVSIHKLAQRNNCLNIFGRDLNISFLFYANNLLGLARNEGNTEFVTSSLIAPLNADVWVRIPRGSESNCKSSSSICVMTGISSCHIIAEDSYFFDGCMAIWDVIEGFSSIGDQSNCFKTDVLQFLHSKKSLKATAATSSTVMPSTIILTEVVCCTQSLMISFCHRHEGFVEAISKVDLQFICSASLVDDSLVWLDLRFSRLVICSSHDSVLATCTSTSSSTFVLSICFSKSIDNMDELSLCLPSLDIWLHLSEWTEIVSFLNHLCLPLEKTPVDAATEHLSVDTSIYIKEAGVKDDSGFLDSESTSMPFTTQETENAVLLVIRSEKICITFNIPIWTSEEPYMELQHAKSRSPTTLSVSSDIVEEKDAEFLTVSVQVNGFELVIGSRDIQLKSNMERLSSVIIFVVNGSHTSLPLLDIIQVQVDAVVSKSDTGNTTFKVELVCDHSDVWLSHPVFYLWGALKFDVPKSESSQYSTGSISFKFQIRKVSVLLTDGKVRC
ncbi:vacuolar sorting-associated protein [Trifolium pratense]|uniref:Vacuolar sorting-associated protein n=1 Tax=Trifolium pratense TaxID=57577 RepID=A0A2K3NXC9_TRIPR|nr:vacuolar sorting-associated protein [Trifolium pratense]